MKASACRRFQPGEGPSRGLLCDCENFAYVRITFVSIFYYEDPADEYKSPEGSLMPLWNFRFEAEKELEVTHLMWSPNYSDLFAVSLGS